MVKDFHPFYNLSEDNMLAVEMWCLTEAQEKLASVGVWPGICHRKDTSSRVPVLEVLVRELIPVDTFTTGAISNCKVASLCHEAADNTVEGTSLEVEWSARLALSFLTSAQSAEVL